MNTTLQASADVHLVAPLLPNGVRANADAGPDAGANCDAWNELLETLTCIRSLADDWDGQGAEAPAVANVDWTSNWVRQMRHYPQAIPPSRAVPGVAGEVYLEWQGPSFDLIAEIGSPARVEWMLSVPGQPSRHWVTEGGIPYFLSPGP